MLTAQKASPKNRSILLVILLLALALRLPGLLWGVRVFEQPHFLYYDENEETIFEIDKDFFFQQPNINDFYPKGYAVQVALLAKPVKSLIADRPYLLITLGRGLSIVYSLLVILLFYWFCCRILEDRALALTAAAVLSLVGSFVTASHFAVTDVGVLFWLYATMHLCLCALQQKHWEKYLLLALVTCAIALAFKLSIIAVIPIIYVLMRKRCSWQWVICSFALLLAIFALANGGQYTWNTILLTADNVFNDNMAVRHNQMLLTPFLYIIILLPALSLPVFLLVGIGIWKCVKHKNIFDRDVFFIWIFPLIIHFISILFIRYIAIRHVLPVIPLLALFAALGWREVQSRLSVRSSQLLAVALLTYQLIFICSTEFYFIFETRRSATHWILNNIPIGEKIALPRYAARLPISHQYKIVGWKEASYVVLHERNYQRYVRSIDNPLSAYPSWNQVFHPNSEDYQYIPAIFRHEKPFKLVRSFEVKPVTPEKWIFKKVFGTFEPLGDVLIYKRL